MADNRGKCVIRNFFVDFRNNQNIQEKLCNIMLFHKRMISLFIQF